MSTRQEEVLRLLRGEEELPGAAPTLPEAAPTQSRLAEVQQKFGARLVDIRNRLLEIDPDFDPSGVPDFTFRADFSRMDTPQEREAFLLRQVGPDGYTKDRFGKYALTPQGMETLGLQHSGKPVLLDEPDITRFDIADLRGDAPAIAGGTAAGIATGGSGFLVGLAGAALGATTGKAIDEAADAIRGDNLQSPGQIAADLGKEAAFSAAGEGFTRGVMLPIGRKLMAPEAKRMTPEAAELMDDALEIGAKPNVSQVTRAPILGRTQSMMNRIFGDPLAMQNSKALGNEMARLIRESGEKIRSSIDLGDLIEANIKRARRDFSKASSAQFQLFDDAVGGRPIVPTENLKLTADAILNELPKTTKGRPVFVAPETVQELSAIADLPDFVTGKQMQAIRSRLWDASRVNNLVPGIEARHARLLRKAAGQSFNQINEQAPELLAKHFDLDLGSELAEKAFREGGPQQVVDNAVASLKQAQKFYAEGIRKFDNAIISRITRDPTFAGSIDPEMVMDAVFKKGRTTSIRRVMELLPNDVQGNVRRAAMEDIIDTVRDRVSDPLTEIFNGPKLARTLEQYGDETLDAMFGQQRREDLWRLAKVTQLVTQRQALSGGLVAAHIALHPLRNLSRLAQLRVLSAVMNSDNGLRWLTTGLEAPKTRAGAAALSRLSAQVAALADEQTQETEF